MPVQTPSAAATASNRGRMSKTALPCVDPGVTGRDLLDPTRRHAHPRHARPGVNFLHLIARKRRYRLNFLNLMPVRSSRPRSGIGAAA